MDFPGRRDGGRGFAIERWVYNWDGDLVCLLSRLMVDRDISTVLYP